MAGPIIGEVQRSGPDAMPVGHSPLATATAGISGSEAGKVSVPEYDLVVIGTGPAGQKGAIAAAKVRKRAAIIDRPLMIGGVSAHTGTVPSKSIREAIFQLTGFAVKARYGDGSRNHS